MTAILYYSQHVPTAWSATTAHASYPASNAGVQQIAAPWAPTAGGIQQLTADLGSSKTIRAIAYQSCPVSAVEARADAAINPPTTVIGSATPQIERHGIYRAHVAADVSARYVSAYFNSPALKGGDPGTYAVSPATYEVGAMYVFGAVLTLPINALIDSEADYNYVHQIERLANGSVVTIERGPPHALIRLDFRPDRTQDVERLARVAQAGICWLNLNIPNRPELQWPIRFADDGFKRTWSGGVDRVSVTLREVT